jgi:hypothetical protein
MLIMASPTTQAKHSSTASFVRPLLSYTCAELQVSNRTSGDVFKALAI